MVSVDVLLKVCLRSVSFFTNIALEEIHGCRGIKGLASGLCDMSEGGESLLGLGGDLTGCARVVSVSTVGQLYVEV